MPKLYLNLACYNLITFYVVVLQLNNFITCLHVKCCVYSFRYNKRFMFLSFYFEWVHLLLLNNGTRFKELN